MTSGVYGNNPWDIDNYERYDYEIFTTCWYSYEGTKSTKFNISDQNPENQVSSLSDESVTEIGILQGPDQFSYFARFFENLVCFVLIFG